VAKLNEVLFQFGSCSIVSSSQHVIIVFTSLDVWRWNTCWGQHKPSCSCCT